MNPAFTKNLAARRMHHGDYEGAVQLLQKVLTEQAEDAEAHALLAICMLRRRRLGVAAREIGLALELDPDSDLALFYAAIVYLDLGRLDEAKQVIDHHVDLQPNDPASYGLLARWHSARNDWPATEDALRSALELRPDDVGTLASLGDVALQQDHLDDARSWLTQALSLDPGSVDALSSMALLLLREDRPEEAREHAVEAVRGNPADHDALTVMCMVASRERPMMGPWWRFVLWFTTLSQPQMVVFWTVGFVVLRLLSMVLTDLGVPQLSRVLMYSWIPLGGYAFYAYRQFTQLLDEALGESELSPDF